MKKNINTVGKLGCLIILIFSIYCILFSCRRVSSSLEVAGGKVINSNDYPAVVHLDIGRGGTCSGSVISSNTILTAAHCTKSNYLPSVFKNTTNQKIKAKVAKANLKYRWPKTGDPEDEKNISKNDVAVWVFEDGTFKDTKDKLQIIDKKPQVGDMARLVGWGCHISVKISWKTPGGKELTCDSRYKSEKRTGTNKISFIPEDLSYIKLHSDTNIIDTQLNREQAATGEGVLATFGDSGGPLLLEKQNTKIIGVASYVETPWEHSCSNISNNDEEKKLDCKYFNSGYANPISSYNINVLQEAVDNHGAIIPGVQVGVGVVEYNGKVKVLYKEESTTFNENVEIHSVIKSFNNNSYNSFESLKQAWRDTNFYERSSASWSFE